MVMPCAQGDHHVAVVDGVAQGVDAGHTRHNDDIPPLGQGRSRRVPQFFDLIIDGAVLFYIGIGPGDIGLGLIVVVVGYKVFHRVVGEKLLELTAELGCQRLVVGQHQGGTVHLGNDIRHSKGLARAGYTQQGLFLVPGQHPRCQLFNGLGLVTGGFIRGYQFKPVLFCHGLTLLSRISSSAPALQ